MNNATKLVYEGVLYSLDRINGLKLEGVENCRRITEAANNLNVVINMLKNGKLIAEEKDEGTQNNS